MSKHLRNQPRISPEVSAQPNEAQPQNIQEVQHNDALRKSENITSFMPNDDVLNTDRPNGDDPDKIPVTPELPDDQVPNMPGAILKHAREMLGMSLREVSNHLMLRVNTVSDIEHDRLNQPTATQFAVQHLTAYARLVNIDPKAVVDLYMQNVRQVQNAALQRSRQAYIETRRKRPLSLGKIALAVAGALALVGVGMGIGAFMSSSSSKEEDQSGALTLSPSAQVEQSMAPKEIFPPVPNETENLPYDPNTEMARQQAQALGTNDLIAKAQGAGTKDPAKSAADEKTHVQEETPTLKRSDAAAVSKFDQEKTEKTSVPLASAAQPASADPLILGAKDKAQTLPTAVPVNDVAKVQKSDTAKDKKATVTVAQPVTSLGSVRDVSSQVKIVSRNDIGSLNTVTVNVQGAVYLRIKGNGKTLKSGSFKAGDTVTATGMPPLRIEVSDSSLVRVRYNGGTAKSPSGKNLGFDLPTR